MHKKLCGYHGENENTNWRRIWRLNVPERVRAFLWMMLHNRMLTNSLKSKMGLNHAMCTFCGDVEETIILILSKSHGVMELCDSHAQWRIHKFLPVGLKNNAYILTKEMCYEF
jgi:hypothetical protein